MECIRSMMFLCSRPVPVFKKFHPQILERSYNFQFSAIKMNYRLGMSSLFKYHNLCFASINRNVPSIAIVLNIIYSNMTLTFSPLSV